MPLSKLPKTHLSISPREFNIWNKETISSTYYSLKISVDVAHILPYSYRNIKKNLSTRRWKY